ncbi:MAG: alpha/beta hydrolase [Burkholderiales bacterium]|nr:alpha/beta hydrolase [Burkholderiales bacterium]
MTEPCLKHVQALNPKGLHRLAYWEWGDPANERVLVCAHGLARQGRDFDALASRLCDRYRVVCPDTVGRGESDWLPDPAGYALPQYVADMVVLLARLNAGELHWLGTSMGGLIGLALASLPGSPVRRLVLNDVGPSIEPTAIQRIAAYVGEQMQFTSLEQGAAALRAISQGFGEFSDADWLRLCRPMFRPMDGATGVRLHYDPAIAHNLRLITPAIAAAAEAQLWDAWDRLQIPVLLLRGAQSDLLSEATATSMSLRGPRARVVTLSGVGHAPMLDRPEQQAPVLAFLA